MLGGFLLNIEEGGERVNAVWMLSINFLFAINLMTRLSISMNNVTK